MNTLDDAQLYFQSKGYYAEFPTLNGGHWSKRKLMVRGRQVPPSPKSLGLTLYGSGLFIFTVDNEWHLEGPGIRYSRLESKFKHLSDAVSTAEDILGLPFEDTKAEREK